MSDRFSYGHRKVGSGYYRDNQPEVSIEEYMHKVARIRLLQDQIMEDRFKMDALEKKALEYSDTIYKYEQELHELQEKLMRANQQIKLQMAKDIQIQVYQQSLREVGAQIAAVNQALIKKNEDYNRLGANTKKLIAQNQQLKNTIKTYTSRQNTIRTKIESLMNMFEENFELDGSEHQIEHGLKIVEENIIDLKAQKLKLTNELEKSKRIANESSFQQKQKLIKLEYQLRLAKERNNDEDKRKNLESTFALDRNTEKVIEEMLRKEDQLVRELERIHIENQGLVQKLDYQIQSRNNYENGRIKELETDLHNAKKQICQLIEEKNRIEQRFEEITSESHLITSRSAHDEVQVSRKYRQLQEQNKRMEMKIVELISDNQMLDKQLRLRTGKNLAYQSIEKENQ